MTGRYEVLRRTQDGERYIFPITQPELHVEFNKKREVKIIKELDDFGVIFPTEFRSGYYGWVPTDNFILHLRPTNLPEYNTEAYVGRFSYEPESGEFLPAPISVAHNVTISNSGSHVFNKYVRGVYIKGQRIILIRTYYNPLDEAGKFDPYKGFDPTEDREKALKTVEMLVDNGLPEGFIIITRANNDLVKSTCLREFIRFI